MSVTYATKYSNVIDEKFAEASMTERAVNSDYDWNGVQSVVVYDVNTVAMNDYTASGSNRYGSPSELGNGTQTMTVGMDRSFTFTIDRKNYNDTQMAMEAGRALARELEQVTIPEVDIYRLAKMIVSSGYVDGTAITSNNAYSKFLDARANLRKNKVPINGVIGFVSTDFYKKIKQDTAFVKASDIGQNLLITGQVGRIDNIAIVEVPDEYILGASFVLTHPVATTAVKKIEEYRTHENPPGISGWLVEGRINYDAFVRTYKKGALAVQISTSGFTTVSTAGEATKTILSTSDIDLALAIKAGFTLKYYAAAAAGYTAKVVGDDCSGLNTYVPASEIIVTATYKVQLILCDSTGKAVIPGTAVVVVLGS